MEKHIFTTLLDYNYISRGFALYNSIQNVCTNGFELYLLAMDDKTNSFFSDNRFENIHIISLDQIKNRYLCLMKLQEQRSKAEFCWTLSAFIIQFVLLEYNVHECTYLDSDIFFFGNPNYLFEKIENESVIITEHNYTPELDQTNTSGKYCVQFVYFKNNEAGNKVLEWWRKKNEEECTIDATRGLCGDQKYLDDWESRFKGDVYSCNSLGCLGPWNLQKVDLFFDEGKMHVRDKISGVVEPLIFFHFQSLSRVKENLWKVPANIVNDDFLEKVYKPYIELMNNNQKHYSMAQIENHNYVRKENVYFIYPIPFLGESSGYDYWIYEDGCRKRLCVKKDDKQVGEIEYLLNDKDGKWIRLEKITGEDIYINFHETLWHLQVKECFRDEDDVYKIIHDIICQAKENQRLLTECPEQLFEDRVINHPEYEIREYYHIEDEGKIRDIRAKFVRKF